MISSTHAIFRGLQCELRDLIRKQKGFSPRLVKGLFDAHLKLSEYYYKFDESPFYLWASRKLSRVLFVQYADSTLNTLLVLDPRISYLALLDEFEDDDDLAPFLETAKNKLHTYYKTCYANKTTPSEPPASSSNKSGQDASLLDSSPKKSFTARYRKPRVAVDELLEFWKLPQEDFDSCNPIQWWLGRRTSFPNLYRLACDILSIPGELSVLFLFLFIYGSLSFAASAVAVERVFSGGRDTISIRRASLRADTIRTLMLVKKSLHLQREHVNKVLT